MLAAKGVMLLPRPKPGFSPRRIAGTYVVVGLIWIFSSDYFVTWILHDPKLGMEKGVAFILLTGLLLLITLSRVAGRLSGYESDLLASREQFRRVIENAPEAIFVQTGGRFRYLNPAATRLLGADHPEALTGSPVLDIVPEPWREIVTQRMEVISRGGEPLPAIELEWRRLDGSTIAVESTVAPIEFQGQSGSLVFARDITERKRAARQREVLEEQIRQSQKMESIGRLAGGVAHDFNNLLTIINGYSDILLTDAPDPATALEHVREIRAAGERAAGLTRQLLAFSRKDVARRTVIDLNATLSEITRMVRRIVREDIQIDVELDPDAGCISEDPTRLNQIVLNLVVNARDAITGTGTISIRSARRTLTAEDCATQPDARPGQYVILTVADTGSGIDPELQSRIFEPFFSTKPAGEGTGLGLSTVYAIVKQSSGWITLASEPGHGAAFSIWLPALDTSAPADATPAAQKSLTGNETVLLVEDDLAVRQTAEACLRKQGYNILTAACGEDALALAAHTEPIHLLLTDVIMPGMTGPELAERLRSLVPGIRILLMSGYVPDSIVSAGSPIIAKPFSAQDLARTVRNLLDEK